MKKLLLVDLGLAWGGQEIYSRSIAQALIERGWSVTCLSSHRRHEISGANFIPCQIGYKNFIDTAQIIFNVAKINNIVHFNGIRAIYLSALLPHKMPFIGTKHLPYSSLEHKTAKAHVARFASNFAFRNIDWLISISSQTLDELPRNIQKRSSVVLNGVEDMGPPALAEFNSATLTVCFVGRFVEHKGLLRLLSAINKIHSQGTDVRLLIAGGGPLESEARAFVDMLKLPHIVKFLGYVELPGEIYRQCHLCVLPSLHEGLPLSLLEAMSAGCALLGHDIPGVRDVIRHEVNGLIADISPDSLASALKRLDADRPLLARLRKNALDDYDLNWRLDRMVDETEAIYRRVIDAKAMDKQ